MLARQNTLGIIKIIVSAGLLGFLLRQFDFASSMVTLSKIPLYFFPIFLLLHVIFVATQALRFIHLVPHSKMGFGRLMRLNFMAFSANNILPAGIGGDIVKAYMIDDLSKKSRLALVFLDRSQGVLLSSIGAALFLFFVPRPLDMALATVLKAAIVCVSSGSLLAGVIGWKVLCDEKHLPAKSLLKSFFWSLLGYGIQCFRFFLMYQVICQCVEMLDMGFLIFGVQFSALLPMTVGGLGLLENVIVYVMATIGVSTTASLAVAVLNRLLVLVISIPGLYFAIRWKKNV